MTHDDWLLHVIGSYHHRVLESRPLILAALLSITATACGGVLADDTDTRPDSFDGGAIDWQEVQPGYEEGTFTVPVDYRDPNGETMELFVARRHASNPSERIGSLLVNPGGPGFPGTQLVYNAEGTYGADLLDHFDIVGWDPRGTGQSDLAIACIGDFDRYFAEVPVVAYDEAERQLAIDRAREMSEKCLTENPEIGTKVGTNNSARDMDVLRRALGEESISYFGFSYGSELGAAWATLFPETVRAAVLDGATDPDSTRAEVRQAAASERALASFFDWCAASSDCSLDSGQAPSEIFDELFSSAEIDPVATADGRAPATQAMLMWATKAALYNESKWPSLASALQDLRDGDGAGVLSLYDGYFQRKPDGTYGHELDANGMITCADEAQRVTPDEADEQMEAETAVAPRMRPPGSVGDYYCSFYPPAEDPRVALTGIGAGPILVVGTTGDPATPLDASEAMAADLEDGHLIVVEADQHTGYGVNDCINDAVGTYLIELVLPAEGTVCG